MSNKSAYQSYVGKTIRIDNMSGEPSYCGRVGVVRYVDDIGQLHGSWGGLAVIVGEDSFSVLESNAKESTKSQT